MCYYTPFGWNIPSRTYSSGNYRYGFNGKEKTEEINEGSYNFGARINDTRIGRWFSVDPVRHPWQSPYASIDNNPISRIDPDGRTGIGAIDKKTLTIKKRLIFYGAKRGNDRQNRRFIKKMVRKIQRAWNKPRGKALINGKEYRVKFDLTGEFDDSGGIEMYKKIGQNASFENNYIRLTEGGKTVTSYFSNSASWSINKILEHNYTTAAHEFGHLVGWRIKPNDRRDITLEQASHNKLGSPSRNGKKQIASIMMANTLSGDTPLEAGLPRIAKRFLDKEGNIVLKRRIVTKFDISKIAYTWSSEALIVSGNKVIFGQLENDYRDKKGNYVDTKGIKKNDVNTREGHY